MNPSNNLSGSKRKEASRHIDVVLKALDILNIFDSRGEINLKQAAELAGMTSNRTVRILGTLESEGYVHRDPKTRTYRLGYRIHALGKAFEKENNLPSICKPILQQLVHVTGESASLFVESGGARMVLAREEGTHDLRFAVSEGNRMPLHAGAGGKILLAYGDDELLENLADNDAMVSFTENTIVDKKKMRQELLDIREKGYATSTGERISHSFAIAAPVFAQDGSLIGALGIAGPEIRFQENQLKARIDLVLDSALSLSKMLGWAEKGSKAQV